jgi:hypothetical protein
VVCNLYTICVENDNELKYLLIITKYQLNMKINSIKKKKKAMGDSSLVFSLLWERPCTTYNTLKLKPNGTTYLK